MSRPKAKPIEPLEAATRAITKALKKSKTHAVTYRKLMPLVGNDELLDAAIKLLRHTNVVSVRGQYIVLLEATDASQKVHVYRGK